MNIYSHNVEADTEDYTDGTLQKKTNSDIGNFYNY